MSDTPPARPGPEELFVCRSTQRCLINVTLNAAETSERAKVVRKHNSARKRYISTWTAGSVTVRAATREEADGRVELFSNPLWPKGDQRGCNARFIDYRTRGSQVTRRVIKLILEMPEIPQQAERRSVRF